MTAIRASVERRLLAGSIVIQQPPSRPLLVHALLLGLTLCIGADMQAIGVRVEFVNRRWSDLLKMAQEGQLQLWMLGIFATTGDAVMLGLYGPNAGHNNLARFRNAEFDDLYRKSKRTRDDAERTRLYDRRATQSLNYLVRAQQQFVWDREAEHLRRLEIEDQLKPPGVFHG